MADDINLLNLNDINISSKSEAEAAQYLCNFAYSDVLDPCKNSKFPGTLVVSLFRQDLEKIQGYPRIHVPYKKEEIIAWIHPVSRQIPPTFFHSTETQEPFPKKPPKKPFHANHIEFGEDCFHCQTPLFYIPNKIDFGIESFEIFSF